MLKIAEYIRIFEELTPAQKAKVDTWKQPHHTFSDHAFGGQDLRTYVPLEHPQEDSPLKQEIEKHLSSVGHKLKDYHEGVATDKYGRAAAISHPNAPADYITKALGDSDNYVRRAAIKHPKATAEHITKALGDSDNYVRYAAISHPKATADHVTKALGDSDEYVRAVAKRKRGTGSSPISEQVAPVRIAKYIGEGAMGGRGPGQAAAPGEADPIQHSADFKRGRPVIRRKIMKGPDGKPLLDSNGNPIARNEPIWVKRRREDDIKVR